jgi:hypothetical protein
MALLRNTEAEYVHLILSSLIDRTPILVVGQPEYEIELLISELASFIQFRHTLMFYSDFILDEDYNNLIEAGEGQEPFSLNQPIFLSYPYSTPKALETLYKFDSWILGSTDPRDSEELQRKIRLLRNKTDYFIIIYVETDRLKVDLDGRCFPQIDITYEKWLYGHALREAENTIQKIQQVVAIRVPTMQIGSEKYESLMNSTARKNDRLAEILRQELYRFYCAGRDTYDLLVRLTTLRHLDYPFQFSKSDLRAVIGNENVSAERMLGFIFHEWGKKFEDLWGVNQASPSSDAFNE